MRWEIGLRPISPGTIPARVWRALVKRKWFRGAIDLGPLPKRSQGIDRGLPVTIAPPPRPVYYSFVEDRRRELEADLVSRFIGKKLVPFEERVDRRLCADRKVALRHHVDGHYMMDVSSRRWVFQWPTELLSFILSRASWARKVLLTDTECEDEWIDDHPSVSTRCHLRRGCLRPGISLFQSVPPPLSVLSGVDNLPLLV